MQGCSADGGTHRIVPQAGLPGSSGDSGPERLQWHKHQGSSGLETCGITTESEIPNCRMPSHRVGVTPHGLAGPQASELQRGKSGELNPNSENPHVAQRDLLLNALSPPHLALLDTLGSK